MHGTEFWHSLRGSFPLLGRQLGRVLRLRAIWACTSCTLRQCWLGTSRTFRRGLRLGALLRIPPKCEEFLVGLRRGLRLGVLGRIPLKCEELLVGLRLVVLGRVIPLLGLCRAGTSPSSGAWLSVRLSLASLLVPSPNPPPLPNQVDQVGRVVW